MFASSMWLLATVVCRGPGFVAAGASRRDGSGRRGGRVHPAQQYHASSGSGHYGGADPGRELPDSRSFYERNGLAPPPLPSRAAAAPRRRAQQVGDATPDPDLSADDGRNLGFTLTTASAEDGAAGAGNTTDLDLPAVAGSDDDAVARLRADLVAGYDKHALPRLPGNRSFAPVELALNFHRVFSVDAVSSVLDLIVWIRLGWADPRLAWRPGEYGDLTEVRFWVADGGPGGETSEIWTPDIELWNMDEGIRSSFNDAYALVQNDGSVFWSRPGHLRPICKLHGLDSFPFDRLTCTMEFGSWSYSGRLMRLIKMGGSGFSVGGSKTAGEMYNEFSFVEENPVQCEVHVYPPFPSSPEDDWPVLLYNVTLERAWQPYARGYVTLQVLLNIVGFSVFWLPPSCGERLGLSITAVLAAVTSDFVISEKLPAFAEYTWIQKFMSFSMTFAFISLFECVIVLYFYYNRKDVIPWWFTKLSHFSRQAGPQASVAREPSASVNETSGNLHSEVNGQPDVKNDSKAYDQTSQDEALSSENSESQNVDAPQNRRLLLQSVGRQPAQSHLAQLMDVTPRDADDFANQEEIVNNKRWKKVADRIDDVCRFWLPLVYFIVLSILLSQVT